MSDKTATWLKSKILDSLFKASLAMRNLAEVEFMNHIQLSSPFRQRARKGYCNTSVTVKIEGYPGNVTYLYDRQKLADVCNGEQHKVHQLPDISPESYGLLPAMLGIDGNEVYVTTVNKIHGRFRVRVSSSASSFKYINSVVVEIHPVSERGPL